MPKAWREGVASLGEGDHACLVCEHDEERWGPIAEFLVQGIDNGELTAYVTAEHGADEARALLGFGGDERLAVLPAREAHGYGAGRSFDLVERLGAWADQARAAVAGGHAGMRVAVDMTWVEQVDISLDELADYERRGTELFRDLPATALCVYDRRRFDDHTIARAGHAHGACIGRCAEPRPVFRSELMGIATAGPGALELSGEVDPSNLAALCRALERSHGGGGLLVDMRALELIDVTGLRAIHRFARRGGGRLVLLSPKPVVRKMVATLGLDGVTVEEAAR